MTIQAVSAQEASATTLLKGPRVTAAYDADGKPTKALEGFARSRGVAVTDVQRRQIDGADVVAIEVADEGRSAVNVLSALIVQVVQGLQADRNMRWSDPALSFSRPIRWVLALWGGTVVPAVISGLETGRVTWVQRQDAQPRREVSDSDSLARIHREAGLVTDIAERRSSVKRQAIALAAEVGGLIDLDAEAPLLEEITNLVESPVGIRGRFEERYLDLPEPVLVTVMRKHQRYLPVRNADGRLLPFFITMANGACEEATVRTGNESVIRARYEDASFFWQADLKVPLEQFRVGLAKLTFEDRIGSMLQRSERIRDVSRQLATAVELDNSQTLALDRAGELAKFDLATQMVVELSSLAGTMAGEYARRAGEPTDVAQALEEMEQPRGIGDTLPRSLSGSLLALADRADAIVAMFRIGVRPSGSSDAFGLRRAALGIVQILRETPQLGAVSLRRLFEAAATRLRDDQVPVDDSVVEEASIFAATRLEQLLRAEGLAHNLVSLVDLREPTRALAMLRDIQQALELNDLPPVA